MSESETSANGRREFLQTVLAAPVLAAALVDTAQAEPAQRDVFVKHAYQEQTVNLGEALRAGADNVVQDTSCVMGNWRP